MIVLFFVFYGVGAIMRAVHAAMQVPCAAEHAAAAARVDVGTDVSQAHQPTGPVTAPATVTVPNTSPADA